MYKNYIKTNDKSTRTDWRYVYTSTLRTNKLKSSIIVISIFQSIIYFILYSQSCRTDFYRDSYFNRIDYLWDALPCAIRTYDTLANLEHADDNRLEDADDNDRTF